MTLMEDEEATLEDLSVVDDDQLLIEVRNKDLTWPEEMVFVAAQLQLQDRRRPSTGKTHHNACFFFRSGPYFHGTFTKRFLF